MERSNEFARADCTQKYQGTETCIIRSTNTESFVLVSRRITCSTFRWERPSSETHDLEGSIGSMSNDSRSQFLWLYICAYRDRFFCANNVLFNVCIRINVSATLYLGSGWSKVWSWKRIWKKMITYSSRSQRSPRVSWSHLEVASVSTINFFQKMIILTNIYNEEKMGISMIQWILMSLMYNTHTHTHTHTHKCYIGWWLKILWIYE